MKIFKKVRYPNGRRHIYLCGMKIVSYKRKNKQQPISHLMCNVTPQQIVRYCANERLPILLRDKFYERTGKMPTEELSTLNEKIIWASMFDVTPQKVQCADKYTVRQYIANKIGKKYLNQMYGCWDNMAEVDFSKLPEKFVLKHSEGSGKVYLVPNKSELDNNAIKTVLRNWEQDEFWSVNMEMQYRDSARKFIAEEYIDTKIDYKLWCFGGKCKFIKIEIMNEFAQNGKPDNQTGKYFWPDWTPADFRTIGAEPLRPIEKPAKLNELIEISEKLAADFDFVRVDFFETNDGDLRFGEMTFSPAAGRIHFVPDIKNEEFGQMFLLPERDERGFAVRDDDKKFK